MPNTKCARWGYGRLRKNDPRALHPSIIRVLRDTTTREELYRHSCWDNPRAWEAAGAVEADVDKRWIAQGYTILDEDGSPMYEEEAV